MKILFIGTVEFSLRALSKLIDMNMKIVGVNTKKSSSFNSDFADLTPICRDNNIPYKYVLDINSKDNIEWIKNLNPDVIFCFGWSSLIKKELLNLTRLGVIGFHPSELPKNRGRHPLIWSLVLGLTESASSFFIMEEGADDGDIISQKKFKIRYKDDATTLYRKITKLAMEQIEDFTLQLKDGTFTKKEQNHSISNTWRKRGKVDGKIDFRMCSYSIYNLVRALTKPYVGAHIEYNGKDILIWKVEEVGNNNDNIEFGKILDTKNNTILVKTMDSSIRILEHEFDVLPDIGEYL
jgi:methionyl-tRNA formyltransferase